MIGTRRTWLEYLRGKTGLVGNGIKGSTVFDVAIPVSFPLDAFRAKRYASRSEIRDPLPALSSARLGSARLRTQQNPILLTW